ncbi:MAG TPA: hypothetical protein VG205_11985 [Acidimicrobiales bacterium]|jgi:hypothetical protein|nr:hypothetical protein [Acidimicrobiales bacterium]
MESNRSLKAEFPAGGHLRPGGENDRLPTRNPAGTAPDRLRWTSDFLDLADKAIRVIACVQGLEYPSDLHRTAQRDLRAWAGYLEDHPSIAADFDMASVVRGVSSP